MVWGNRAEPLAGSISAVRIRLGSHAVGFFVGSAPAVPILVSALS